VAPRYSDDDIESERSVILEEIKMVEDTPDDLVHEIFVEKFWPDHPLGRPILGTEQTVNELQRQQIADHYRETFHPANVIFCTSDTRRSTPRARRRTSNACSASRSRRCASCVTTTPPPTSCRPRNCISRARSSSRSSRP